MEGDAISVGKALFNRSCWTNATQAPFIHLRGNNKCRQSIHLKGGALLVLQIVDYLEDEDASCLVRVCHYFLHLLIYRYHRYDDHGRTLLINVSILGHVKVV